MTDKLKDAMKRVFDVLVEENPNAVEATIEIKPGGWVSIEVKLSDRTNVLTQRL